MTALIGLPSEDTNTSLRQVATGSKVPWVRDTTNKSRMSRTMHFARDQITSLRLAWANWYVASFDTPTDGTEWTQGTNSTTIEASIEYPAGTFKRVYFHGGSTVGTIRAGTTLLSDEVKVNIPNGAQFWVRNLQNNPDGVSRPAGIPMGSLNNSTTSTTNLVMSGSVTGNAGYGVTPLAILGYSTKPVIAIVGDSIFNGEAGTIADRLYTGIERLVGPSYAFINLATSGDRANYVAATSNGTPSKFAKRGAMLQYCTHVIGNHGVNDFTASRTAAQVATDLATFYGFSYFTGKPIFHATITPKTATTSESDYTTDEGQNTHSTNAERVAFNVALRNGDMSAWCSNILDMEKFTQSPTKTGVWMPYDGTALTTDGTHPNRHAFTYLAGQMPFPPFT
jgi:hypothetical protein